MEPLLNSEKVSKRYFYPRKASFENPYYVQSGENQLACYYHKIENPKKTIIHFHGNGETVADYLNDFEHKVETLGCSILFAEYRQYGLSTGKPPTLVGMLEDVEKIINSIDVPPEEIILFGRSVGSIYAIHGASLFPNISGLVIESGIANVVNRVFRLIRRPNHSIREQMIQEGKKYFDHEAKLKAFQGKVLIMHTLYDSLVHASNARQLYQWANDPKELELFLEGDHNCILISNKEAYFQLLKNLIEG